MISILGQIEAEHPELFAIEFGKIAESDFVYTLASTNINQSAPSLVKMFVTISSRMSLIMDLSSQMSSITGQIEAEHPELFACEFGKIAEYDFFYTLSSTNINQSAQNLVRMYVTIRSRITLIMDVIGSELPE